MPSSSRDIAGMMNVPRYRVVEDSDRSLQNWIEQFNLVCATKNKFGLFGSLYFVGLVIGSIVLPRLSDIYGRKKVMIFGNLLHIIPCVVFLLSKDVNISFLMMTITGAGMASRVFVGYVWMTENMRIKDVPKCTAFMLTMDSLCICIATIYFQFISKDWKYLFGVPLLALCVI